jgi:hypothetical protein
MTKVTFNGIEKEITVDSGVTSLDVTIDIYSDWKEWAVLSNNLSYLPALRTFGGDDTASGQKAPRYFFLTNGWRLIITDLNLSIKGNLYTDEGDTPFVATDSVITHSTSDAAVVSTGGSALTSQESTKLLGLPDANTIATAVLDKEV